MPKFKSLFKVKGSLDDVSFFKNRNGYQARMKSGVDGDRIATDPKFKRTRENAAEFTAVAASMKVVRSALRPVIQGIADGGMNGRLSRVLHQVKRLDLTSDRGQRTVAVGLESEAGRAALVGFPFNAQAPLETVLAVIPVLDPATGVVTLPGMVSERDLSIPDGLCGLIRTGNVQFVAIFIQNHNLTLWVRINQVVTVVSSKDTVFEWNV